MVTASTLKAWLYRHVSEMAAWNHAQALDRDGSTAIYSESFEALDRLAAYVLGLPDDDPRLTMLATAYPPHRTLDELRQLQPRRSLRELRPPRLLRQQPESLAQRVRPLGA